jgi:hypothetical protein
VLRYLDVRSTPSTAVGAGAVLARRDRRGRGVGLLKYPGKAKICNFDEGILVLAFEEYVFGLDIEVDDVLRVQGVQLRIPVQTFSQKGYSRTQFSVKKDIPVQNIQSVRIPVQNIQSKRIFQHTIFSQKGHSRTQYSVKKDIPAHNIQSKRISQ